MRKAIKAVFSIIYPDLKKQTTCKLAVAHTLQLKLCCFLAAKWKQLDLQESWAKQDWNLTKPSQIKLCSILVHVISPLQFSLDETPWKASFEAVLTFSVSLAKYEMKDCKQFLTDRARSFLVLHWFVSKNYDLVFHQESYELLTGYPFQSYMGSYTDDPRREMENNILTRLYAISAYTLTPKGLILAVKSTMPDFKFSNFPLRSVKRVMKSFTEKLDSHLQEVWKNNHS